ncbi:uncharacterized protein KGF55_001408 [Candida pseudojiufengensis]|uniref:uncharacterized protein n=1 Tax=Candida pseudojiufengensis TaxID=497109 RepID=UPI002224E100|nr:uncharacterized protein KGF55_001408 [Candida pseudojiufengensis]KAI5965188.1 hypothetical protein KGF55_001408 [Candida pseudojiufengensis]
MDREFSPITFNGIESESTPIKSLNGSPHSEFLTADGIVNTSITIDEDVRENDKTKEIEEIVDILENENELSNGATPLNPVNVAHLMFSPKRRQQQRELEKLNPIPFQENPTKSKKASFTAETKNNQTFLNNPSIPYTLNLYLQLIINVILWLFILYLGFISFKTIRADIKNKIEDKLTILLDEIANCEKQYIANKCNLPNRPPAINQECNALEKCQNQQIKVYNTQATLQLLAEVINSFVDQLSLKTILLSFFIILGMIIHSAFTLNNFKAFEQISREKNNEKNNQKDVGNKKKVKVDETVQFSEEFSK